MNVPARWLLQPSPLPVSTGPRVLIAYLWNHLDQLAHTVKYTTALAQTMFACALAHVHTKAHFTLLSKHTKTLHTQQSQIFSHFSESGFVPPHDHLSSLFLSTQQFIQQGVARETSAAIVKV